MPIKICVLPKALADPAIDWEWGCWSLPDGIQAELCGNAGHDLRGGCIGQKRACWAGARQKLDWHSGVKILKIVTKDCDGQPQQLGSAYRVCSIHDAMLQLQGQGEQTICCGCQLEITQHISSNDNRLWGNMAKTILQQKLQNHIHFNFVLLKSWRRSLESFSQI